MSQSRVESACEAISNAVVGVAISIGFTMWWFGASLNESAVVTGFYLVLSSVRSYALRRFFEWAPWR